MATLPTQTKLGFRGGAPLRSDANRPPERLLSFTGEREILWVVPCFWFLLVGLLALSGCRPAVVPNRDFHEPTLAGSVTLAELQRLSVGDRRREVKFIIASFDDTNGRQLVLLDGHFYRMHDEWYWMRLLNGIGVPGGNARPLSGLDLRSVKSAYAWAKSHDLPFDLAWSEDGRLFSSAFYESCFGEDRRFGIGSLIQIEAVNAPKAASWVFQLEFMDYPSPEILRVFFEVLQRSLPEAISSKLRWLTRSAEQEEFARQLRAAHQPLAQRILRQRDVVAKDRVEVYSEGVTAGQVRMFKERPPAPGTTSSEDIVVLATAPDELPAAAALITATPQTPLAHVALLAQNRGIPSAFLDQAFTDPVLATATRDRTKAILRSELPNRLALVPITDEQFATWNALRRPSPLAGTRVDASNAAYSADLASLRYSDVSQLRPLIGGKAAGYLLMATQHHLDVPRPARVITTRAYDEHLAALRPIVDRTLREPAFATDAKIRYLLLEGIARFTATHPGDKKTVPRFLAGRGSGDPLVGMVRRGGLTGAIRDVPMAPRTMRRLREDLGEQFTGFVGALRFRSSSTVEDIDGFNAAGLYASATGIFGPTPGQEPGGARRSLEQAIKKVWASYWGFVAFEERLRERIDHHSGAMAILVHPRFDDVAELANGVVTFTRMPDASERMRVAVQIGSTSVTNPEGSSQPELEDVVSGAAEGSSPKVTRLQASSMSRHAVLDDEQLFQLFRAAAALTDTARHAANRRLSILQQRQVYAVDIEFRLMASSWLPRSRAGDASPRLILKQARSLEPEPRGMAAQLFEEPIARDILTRARRIDRYRCRGRTYTIEFLSLLTDVKSLPDMGYRDKPLTAWVQLEEPARAPVRWLHRDFSSLTRSHTQGDAAWVLEAELGPRAAAQCHWRKIELDPNRITLTRDDGHTASESVECSRAVLHNTADAYLLDLMAQ